METLLEHRHAHSVTYCPWLILYYNGELSSCNRHHIVRKTSRKKCAKPCSKGFGQEGTKLNFFSLHLENCVMSPL